MERLNQLHRCVDELALEQEKISKGLENKYFKRLSATYEVKETGDQQRAFMLKNLVNP